MKILGVNIFKTLIITCRNKPVKQENEDINENKFIKNQMNQYENRMYE